MGFMMIHTEVAAVDLQGYFKHGATLPARAFLSAEDDVSSVHTV